MQSRQRRLPAFHSSLIMQEKLRRIIRYNYIRLKRLQGDPPRLALSTALGVFIGLTPTLPLHTVMIVATALSLRINPIPAFVGSTIVSNPLTFALHYFLAWWLGDLLLPDRLTWSRVQETLTVLRADGLSAGLKTLGTLSFDAVLVMMAGGTLLALPFAAASYYLSLNFFIKIRNKRREKHILR